MEKVWPQLLRQLKVPLRETAVVEGWLVTAQRLPASKRRIKSIRIVDSGQMERLAAEHGITWNKMKHVFPEGQRPIRMLSVTGLHDLAELLGNKRI